VAAAEAAAAALAAALVAEVEAAFWDANDAAAELLEAVAEAALLAAWVVEVAAFVEAEVALAALAF
jgi:hypothetical protein